MVDLITDLQFLRLLLHLRETISCVSPPFRCYTLVPFDRVSAATFSIRVPSSDSANVKNQY